MAVLCVAIISKQYLVHASIDVVEEKISALTSSKSSNDPREHYLGLLYPSEQYKIYGYATNTRVKLIIVTENTTSQSRDIQIKALFKSLHVAYTDMLSNPFYTPGTKINSKVFDRVVSGLFQTSKTP
ncbi:trafficking protein particle complex subunit 2-like protein isoform X2 [Halichondria panicea]|uniref:trafficking protein particle complex subunit 2-like protein isoform X2 n=1 Tax=Halichondria panicea TaxID=6063 RepID=UPI00312B6842